MSDTLLSTFDDGLTVAVVGASGGLGRAFVQHLIEQPKTSTIFTFSRSGEFHSNSKVKSYEMDLQSEDAIQEALNAVDKDFTFDIVIVATGLLHNDVVSPEKSMKDLSMNQLAQVFAVNTFGPALIAKHFLPRMNRTRKSIFACLSARVGSISDNRLGGWYAYRASKAALNMILKNAAIESARRNKQGCVIGLHPGTVDTALSKPFQSNVKNDKLFTAEHASECLLKVINSMTPAHSGKVFAWDGSEVPA